MLPSTYIIYRPDGCEVWSPDCALKLETLDDVGEQVVSRHDGEGQRKLRSRGGGGGEGKRVIFDARPYVKVREGLLGWRCRSIESSEQVERT